MRPYLKTTVAVCVVALLILGVVLWVFQDDLRATRARAAHPRIVLVTFDTLNVLFTGPYGDGVELTPELDRFAAEGVVFENAYTRVPITLPAHASLLTGIEPRDLGVMLNGDYLVDEFVTLPELLSQAGYRTAAFTSLGVLSSKFNIGQGFDHYDDEQPRRWYRTADEVVAAADAWVTANRDAPFFAWLHLSDPHEPYLRKGAPPDLRLLIDDQEVGRWTLASKESFSTRVTVPPGRHLLTWEPLREPRADDGEATALVLEMVADRGLEELMPDAFAATEGEHWLYEPLTLEIENRNAEPIELALAFTGRINAPPPSEVFEEYEVEVAFADEQLGLFRRRLEELELDDDTLWVLSSDHGEGLFHHGAIGHATTGHEDQLRILCILRGPGLPAGLRLTGQPILTEDLMPTLIDLLGLRHRSRVSGRSQSGCWRRRGCPEPRRWWAYGASASREEITALAGYDWPIKLLWHKSGRSGAFDVAADPREEQNIAGGRGRRPDPRLAELMDFNDRIPQEIRAIQRAIDERSLGELSAEREEMLKSLGYLGN